MYATEIQYTQEDIFIEVLEHTPIEALPRFIKPVRHTVEDSCEPLVIRLSYSVRPVKMLMDASEAALSKVASLYLSGFSRGDVVAAIAAEREEYSRKERMRMHAQQEAWEDTNKVFLSTHAQLLAESVPKQAMNLKSLAQLGKRYK